MQSAGAVHESEPNLRRAVPPMPMVVALAVLLALCITTGCANDQQRTRAEGTGIGALIGAGLGAAIGGREGAVVGGVVGGVAGGIYGDHQAKKKQQFADREDALQLAVAQAQQTTRNAREANESVQRDIAALQDSVKRLQNEHANARRHTELARTTQHRIEQTNHRIDQQLVAVRGEIDRQQRALARDAELARSAPQAPAPSLQLVKAGVEDLRSQERALEQAKAQLALLDPSRAF